MEMDMGRQSRYFKQRSGDGWHRPCHLFSFAYISIFSFLSFFYFFFPLVIVFFFFFFFFFFFLIFANKKIDVNQVSHKFMTY